VIGDVDWRIVVEETSESVGEVKVMEIWEEDGDVTEDEEVITRLPVPDVETATNTLLPYATDCHCLSAALTVAVHVLASLEVITRLFVKSFETATKTPPPYDTELRALLVERTRILQVTPSSDVIIEFVPPDSETATNTPLP
jgi:hypothetical protein